MRSGLLLPLAVGGLLLALPSSAQAQTADQAEPASAQPAAVASAEDARAEATSREDPARYPPSSVRWKLIAGGLGLTAGAYGIGAACAAAWPEVPGAEALYVPVAGPWITLGQSGCAPDDEGCGAILVVRGILLVLDGLIQAGGVAVAGEGLFMTTESDTASARVAPRHETAVTLTPVPLVTETQTGVGVLGSF